MGGICGSLANIRLSLQLDELTPISYGNASSGSSAALSGSTGATSAIQTGALATSGRSMHQIGISTSAFFMDNTDAWGS